MRAAQRKLLGIVAIPLLCAQAVASDSTTPVERVRAPRKPSVITRVQPGEVIPAGGYRGCKGRRKTGPRHQSNVTQGEGS